MKGDAPLVTILLPVHNGFPYLPEAVDSIVQQTEHRWKLIAVNDGSVDETQSYLDSLTDSRIEVIHQPNRGLSQTLNVGLERCETKYVARMDCDDVSYPDRLAKQIAFLNANHDVGMVGTQIHRIGSRRVSRPSNLPETHERIFETLLDGHHAICHPSIMCRKKAFDEVGGYRDGLGEEWDLFLRFGESWRLANLPDVLFGYRYHGKSINGSKMDELRRRIRYSCECSRCRIADQVKPSYEDFLAQEGKWSYLQKLTQRIEDYSRANYHAAMIDILGEHPVRGYARLGVAAASAPHITFQRIVSRLRKKADESSSSR